MDFSADALDEYVQRAFSTPDWLKLPIPPDFDEARYLALYPDIGAAVEAGKMASGFEHYVRYGRAEGRERPTRLAR